MACGFAVFYNTPWSRLWMAALGGMAGHGLRFLALEAGCRLQAATFLGGLAVGAVSAWMARSGKTPVAVIAFAGAVTMMPGLQVYRALGGALRAGPAGGGRPGDMAGPSAMLASVPRGAALALGLVLGARVVLVLFGQRDAPVSCRGGGDKSFLDESLACGGGDGKLH